MKNFINLTIFLLNFILLSLEWAIAASINFIVSPPIVELKMHPGSTKKIELTVYNKNSNALNLNVETVSLEMDKYGNAVVSDSEYDPFSCATWFHIDKKKLSILPNNKVILPVEIKVPYGINGGKYGIVLFQTNNLKRDKDEIKLTGRMGTIFLISIFGHKEISGKIANFKLSQENGIINFTALIQNSGNIHFKTKGTILIKNEKNTIIDRVNLKIGTGTILPKHEREFCAVWDNSRKMLPGNYAAILQIRIPGMGRILQETKDFLIK